MPLLLRRKFVKTMAMSASVPMLVVTLMPAFSAIESDSLPALGICVSVADAVDVVITELDRGCAEIVKVDRTGADVRVKKANSLSIQRIPIRGRIAAKLPIKLSLPMKHD